MKLPVAGITLLPPWLAFILFAGKRTENRAPSVAGRLRNWRGLIALGQSKTFDREECEGEWLSMWDEPWFQWHGPPTHPLGPFIHDTMSRWAGHIVGVAELRNVRRNGPEPTDPWAVPGQAGLILGHVWQIEPVPCSGGRGVCTIGACAACGHVGSIENIGAPLVCRKCKATTPRDRLGRPELRVVAAFGPDGRPVA